MSALLSLVLLLPAASVPTCRTADVRLEQLITAKASELQGSEHCQFRLYHTLHDVDGDGADDFLVVFTVEGTGGGNTVSQFLVLFPSARNWEPLTVQVGRKGERFVEGVDVEEGAIVLRTSEYEKSDPECCPSGRGELRYTFLRGRLLAAEVPRPPRPKK